MKEKSQRFAAGNSSAVALSGIAIVLVILGFVLAYNFVEPAPPNQIIMAAGQDGGAYQRYAEDFATYLAREGLQTEVRATAGSVENLNLLNGDNDVELGFVQGGLAGSVPAENVVVIGSLYLEPLWFFLRTDVELGDLDDLAGKRIAVGSAGSGTRVVVLNLLAAHGVTSETSAMLDFSPDQLARAFSNGSIDAAFVIEAAESPRIVELMNLEYVALQDLKSADAYVRRFPYMSKIELPQGILDLKTDQPPRDTTTVALTAMLAANRNLHPALIDLLLVAATSIHGKHSLLADAGQFPTPLYTDLPLSEEAERHFKHGPPFLTRYLPFWAATLVDRLWIMLLPLIGLAIPLIKLLPPAYQWQIRRRLLRLYSELEQIDPLSNKIKDDVDLASRLQRLEHLDNASAVESVPRAFTDNIYKLRRDIDLVRRRLAAASTPET